MSGAEWQTPVKYFLRYSTTMTIRCSLPIGNNTDTIWDRRSNVQCLFIGPKLIYTGIALLRHLTRSRESCKNTTLIVFHFAKNLMEARTMLEFLSQELPQIMRRKLPWLKMYIFLRNPAPNHFNSLCNVLIPERHSSRATDSSNFRGPLYSSWWNISKALNVAIAVCKLQARCLSPLLTIAVVGDLSFTATLDFLLRRIEQSHIKIEWKLTPCAYNPF